MIETTLSASFYLQPDGNGLMLAARCCAGWHLPIAGNPPAIDTACRRHMIERHEFPNDGPELYLFRPHPTSIPNVELLS